MPLGAGGSGGASAAELGYSQGRAYRVDIPFTIPQGAGGTVFLKYQIGGNIDLTSSTLDMDVGAITYTVWTGGQASGEAGIDTPVEIYPRNLKSDVPARDSDMVITKGNDWDGATLTLTGQQNSTTPARAPTGGSSKASTVADDGSTRGFPAAVAYVRITKTAGTNAETFGVLKQEWTEYD